MKILGYQAAFAALTDETHLHCGSHCPPTNLSQDPQDFHEGLTLGKAELAQHEAHWNCDFLDSTY